MLLPDLRILPLDVLIPHEQTDPRRVDPLTLRLKGEAVLRNPPIVAPFDAQGAPDERSYFVVLDGANRTAAFRALGVPHILAQVVEYGQVQLHIWHHVLTACGIPNLVTRISAIDGLTVRETNHISARAALARREALAYISVDISGLSADTDITHRSSLAPLEAHGQAPAHTPAFAPALALCGGHDLVERTELLNQLVRVYEGCAKVQRTTSDNLREVRESFPDAGAVVAFPRFEPAEIVDLARQGVRLPAGITRHVLPQRALRLNYPLDLLQSPQPLAEKQARLNAWVRERVQDRRVRVYAEPTVLFDE